ncbi:hypothetical protein DFP72DRAFT_583486 [Ephemerocybe angulata]|uniref:DUF1308 domain-containing protein n=1 Tax=Ephemerocybe angulata TaxID=980116 RepID=A0A8H6HKH5_9AGAR|nr:hypothetical protein DFP72DRAFT_583486 [Tulosesus angulatus]
MVEVPGAATHPELYDLLQRLHGIYDAVSNYQPPNVQPPILDSSFEADTGDDTHWSHQDHIPGLKKLKEALKLDLDGLEKFLEDPSSAHRPPLSTNAPYLISVWNELLCAPGPVLSVFKTFLFEPKGDVRMPPSAQRKKTGVRPPGAKVDIVGDGGRVWIRINTMKNSRLLAEFREIDSYLTESEEDSDWDGDERPTLAQTEFDNSILKMGRTLLQAAQSNPIEGTTELPRVVMRLTRLDPLTTEGPEADPRIATTVEKLEEMGIEVQLGEREEEELVVPAPIEDVDTQTLVPSRRINLDLSVLIALISDLTHAPLPASIEEANKRFIPPKEYREWKQTRKRQARKKGSGSDSGGGAEDVDEELSIEDLPHDLATHSRALTNQLLGEMGRSMIQEIRDRISQSAVGGATEFWVTTEARDRCLRIVSKIGAVNEKRRAFALFCLDPSDPTQTIPLAEAEALFWLGSRFDRAIPLFPLHFHSASLLVAPVGVPHTSLLDERGGRHAFFKDLAGTCQHILDQETMPHPNSRPSLQFQFISQPTPFPSQQLNGAPTVAAEGSEVLTSATTPAIDLNPEEEIQRAVVTKANPRLTAHTVESMLWGAELGWTTLTANRTSVRAILKEMRIARAAGKTGGGEKDGRDETGEEGEGGRSGREGGRSAALWIVDPRSLAEQMCSQTVVVPGTDFDRSNSKVPQ